MNMSMMNSLYLRRGLQTFVGRITVPKNTSQAKPPSAEQLAQIKEVPSKDASTYHIQRTERGFLPVYVAQTNTKIKTTIKGIQGEIMHLANHLRQIVPAEDIKVKQHTWHIELKGNRQEQVRAWLNERGF